MTSSTVVCQCCLLRPPDKDLKTPYQRSEKSEVYADMLKECFEIHLLLSGREGDSGICEVCVTRLRDAYEFKLQVQQCQKHLQALHEVIAGSINKDGTPLKVKEEVADPDLVFMELKTEIPEYGFQDEDDQNLVEMLGLSDVTIKRKSERHRSDRKHRLLCEDGRTDLKTDTVNPTLLKLSLRTLSKRLKKKKKKNLTSHLRISKLTDADKRRANVINILKYSNCTPFSNKTIAGMACAYCKGNFQNLTELKLHIEATHKPEEFTNQSKDSSNLTVKMDITELKCKVCQTEMSVIKNLKMHLLNVHDVKMFADVDDYMMEFKITGDEMMNCALCNSSYETFKMLLQHMNGHYRNFICDKCDGGFINKHRLKLHQRTHETGDFNCSFCDKVFTTKVRKVLHEKYTHNNGAVRYKTLCPHCNASFTSYYQRNRHMAKDHGIAAATYKCNICDKSFILKSKLTMHVKKVHLLERNHICAECGQEFFMKQSLDEHMIKHNGERVFKCTVCSKAYARKKTLREHMRIHNNDRRFRCGVCGLTFVQKCSLKSHMLSNHGVTLVEFENARTLSSNGIPEWRPPE